MYTKKLMDIIKRYNVISFDIYDTLIKRNVNKPENVFDLVAMKYFYMNNVEIENFKELRLKAYHDAYKEHGASCTIDHIYEYLDSSRIQGVDTSKLKEIEIEIEINISVPNLELIEIYKYAKECGKRIVLLSDMYMPRNVISKILDKCEISGYEEFFLSCEYGVSKTDGGLYDICAKKARLNKREWLHLGDGWKNDIVRAKMKGIHSYHISSHTYLNYNDIKGFGEREKTLYMLQQSILSNKLFGISDMSEKLGYEVFGPLIYGFTLWLHKKIAEHDIRKIYFLAREGKIFKEAYQIVYPKDNVEIHYLYVSRRSLISPTYWIKPDYESVMNSIAKSKYVSISSQIERWGLTSDECKNEVEEVGLSMSSNIHGRKWKENESLKRLFYLLQERIIHNSKIRYEFLKKYLQQENFGGECAIVDIGWNGGMQNAFQKIASVWEIPTIIHGFYIGINDVNLGTKLENVYGYVYEQERRKENRLLIYSFAGPLEFSLTAPHATTIGYAQEEKKIVPIFENRPCKNEDGLLEDVYKHSVQDGIRKCVKDLGKYGEEFLGNVSSEIAFRNCKLFGTNPKVKHIHLFSQFSANDLGETQHFVNPEYRHLFGDNTITSGFWKSTWKSGYMKYMFKLPLPYDKIYAYIRGKIE